MRRKVAGGENLSQGEGKRGSSKSVARPVFKKGVKTEETKPIKKKKKNQCEERRRGAHSLPFNTKSGKPRRRGQGGGEGRQDGNKGGGTRNGERRKSQFSFLNR